MRHWMRRVICMLVLAVLAGTPVMGAVCATLCEPAPAHQSTARTAMPTHHAASATSSEHHAAPGEDCHGAAAPTTADTLATAGHACGPHDAAFRDAAALPAAGRDNAGKLGDVVAPGPAGVWFAGGPASLASLSHGAAIGLRTPAHRSFALRI